MSSDEEDFFVVAEDADSNEEASEILSDSDSYEDLEDSYEISSIEDLLEQENQKFFVESTSFMDEDTQNLSLRDLINLSCVRYGMPTYKFQLYKWKRHKVVTTKCKEDVTNAYSDGDRSRNYRDIPIARSGHRMVFHDGRLYAFGGYNPILPEREQLFRELWEYNIATRRWKQIEMQGSVPQNLASHTACVVDDNASGTSRSAKMLVYGGTGTPFGINMSRGVFLCDLHGDFRWSRLKIRAVQDVNVTDGSLAEISFSDNEEEHLDSDDHHVHLPRPLYGQAIAMVNDPEDGPQLYTIGGTSGFDYFIDVDRLVFRHRRWEPCYRSFHDYTRLSGNEPDARYRHELAVRKGLIYLLGGGTSFIVHDFVDIWAFDTKMKNKELRQIYQENLRDTNTNFLERKLNESRSRERPPVSQMGRGAWIKKKSMPDKDVTIIDGVEDQYPPARRCHGTVQKGKYAYIFGGYNGTDIFGDLWRLDLDTLAWKKLPNDMAEPAYFHGTTITPRGQLFSFGGVTSIESNERSDKIHSLWFDIPSLREMAWQAMQHYLPDIENVRVSTLREAGVPLDLIDTIQDESRLKSPQPNQPDVG